MSVGVPRKRKTRVEKDAIKQRRADRATAARTFTETQGRMFPEPLGSNVIPIRREA